MCLKQVLSLCPSYHATHVVYLMPCIPVTVPPCIILGIHGVLTAGRESMEVVIGTCKPLVNSMVMRHGHV